MFGAWRTLKWQVQFSCKTSTCLICAERFAYDNFTTNLFVVNKRVIHTMPLAMNSFYNLHFILNFFLSALLPSFNNSKERHCWENNNEKHPIQTNEIKRRLSIFLRCAQYLRARWSLHRSKQSACISSQSIFPQYCCCCFFCPIDGA